MFCFWFGSNTSVRVGCGWFIESVRCQMESVCVLVAGGLGYSILWCLGDCFVALSRDYTTIY